MERTKLTSLQKNDLLSNWQKQQKDKGYQNAQFFLAQPQYDPWQIKRAQEEALTKVIPALKGHKFGYARNNKEINQVIQNKKWENIRKNFYQS